MTRPPRGFTLLELLVVLALVGLVTAVAAPGLERLYAALTRASERDYVLDQFAGLGLRAMHQGRSFVVFGSEGAPASALPAPAALLVRDGYEPFAIDLPEGWELRLEPPLRVRASGVCLGAELVLQHRGTEDSRLDLQAPWCRIDPDA